MGTYSTVRVARCRMVDSILASANRVPRVLLAHAKNTTRVYPSDYSRVFFNLPVDCTVCFGASYLLVQLSTQSWVWLVRPVRTML